MRIEKHPMGYDARQRFPDMRRVKLFEGGAIYAAEKFGRFYLIIDEGTMADFLMPEDEDLLSELVKVIEFETEEEREAYLRDKKS